MTNIQAPTTTAVALRPLEAPPIRPLPVPVPECLTVDHAAILARHGDVPAISRTMDLFTYNVWGLPGLIGQRKAERMEQIGNAVQGNDVVCLQETFTKKAERIEELAGYDTVVKGSDGGPFKMKSGLTVLTDYPVLESEFVPFRKAAGFDAIAAKGVLFVRVAVPAIGPVDVYDTHYQAHDANAKVRQHDNDVMVAAVQKHDQGYPTFIMGDFNFTPETAEYADLKARLGLRDSFAEVHPGDPGHTSAADNSNRRDGAKSQRLDYIFVRDSERFDIAIDRVERAMTQTFNGKHASDHYAVHGRFVIRPKTETVAP